MDDIVSKLRYAAIIIGDDIEVIPATYLLEAAAEIELLRQWLVQTLKAQSQSEAPF